MAYKTQNEAQIGTRPVSARIRRDLLDYIEMNVENRNGFINECIVLGVKIHQEMQYIPKRIKFKTWSKNGWSGMNCDATVEYCNE